MRKKFLIGASVISVGLLLGGCALLNSGPPRDSAGKVTESTSISARDLLDGDCFSFNSASGEIVEDVTVMPCSLEHDYVVIGHGTLTSSDVSTAGSLQNAVSVACATPFETFKTAITGDTRPKQEFLVFAETDEADADQMYSCISTDPDQFAADATPAP